MLLPDREPNSPNHFYFGCLIFFVLGRLHRKAKQFAMRNFSKVSKKEEFLRLSLPVITKYLADDQLVAKREEHVYEAALRWLEVIFT